MPKAYESTFRTEVRERSGTTAKSSNVKTSCDDQYINQGFEASWSTNAFLPYWPQWHTWPSFGETNEALPGQGPPWEAKQLVTLIEVRLVKVLSGICVSEPIPVSENHQCRYTGVNLGHNVPELLDFLKQTWICLLRLPCSIPSFWRLIEHLSPSNFIVSLLNCISFLDRGRMSNEELGSIIIWYYHPTSTVYQVHIESYTGCRCEAITTANSSG